MPKRRYNVCDHCNRICYLVQLHDGTISWVSHMTGRDGSGGRITCPKFDTTTSPATSS